MTDGTEGRGQQSAPLKEWNASAYHRVSEPQFAWGLRVLDRLSLRGDERALDAGCGSGRLTRELAARLPAGSVVACDLSENMVRAAATTLGLASGGPLPSEPCAHAVICADLLALPFRRCFDVIFSTATFHWVRNHERLFGGLRESLRHPGVLEAQCGGGANLQRVHARATALASTTRFRPYFSTWEDPWVYPWPDDAEALIRRAGFARVRCWLDESPTSFADAERYRSFLESVVMRPFLARLPTADLRSRFLDALVDAAAADDHPFTLDYWRLNISAATV
jgi:trans-aconitate methyltransferase